MPKLIVYGLAMLMLNKGKKDVALKAMLDFDTYIGPGGSINLLNKQPGERSRSPIQVVLGDCPRLPRETSRQGGGLRQHYCTQHSREAVVGRSSCDHDERQEEHRENLCIHHGRVSGRRFSEMSKKVGILQLHPYHLRHEGATRIQAASRGTRLQ